VTTHAGTPSEVFRVALRLGLTSFGGAVAHIGYFRREYVERRAWLDPATFADFVALGQSLPGPASSQLGIAIGTHRAGVLGGIAAWLGFTLPSAVVQTSLGLVATRVDLADAGWVHGLQVAAVAVVASAVWALAVALTPDRPRRVVALVAAAVALLWVAPVSQLAIIAGGAVVGYLVLDPPASDPAVAGAAARAAGPSPVPRWFGNACLATFVVLLVALVPLRVVGGQAVALFDAFFRSGALVFGGGHVVLPLLHATVVDPGWVSDDAFLAGYGATQAMPGPLFTFAGYLGAVSSVPPAGILGAVIALVGIFLPSFLLVFGVLPYWHALRDWTPLRRALGGVNAAVVGLLLAALYTPVWTSAIRSPVDVAIAGAGLVGLLSGRVPPIAVVAAAALLGAMTAGTVSAA
jgi:chromate transporter